MLGSAFSGSLAGPRGVQLTLPPYNFSSIFDFCVGRPCVLKALVYSGQQFRVVYITACTSLCSVGLAVIQRFRLTAPGIRKFFAVTSRSHFPSPQAKPRALQCFWGSLAPYFRPPARQHALGGSWVVIRGYKEGNYTYIIHFRGLIPPTYSYP